MRKIISLMGRVGYWRSVGSRMGIQPYPWVLSGTRCRRPLCQMQHAYPTSPPCLLASLARSHSLLASPILHSLPSSTLSLKLPSLPHDSIVHLPVPLGDATAHRAPGNKAAAFDHRTTTPLRSRPLSLASCSSLMLSIVLMASPRRPCAPHRLAEWAPRRARRAPWRARRAPRRPGAPPSPCLAFTP
jgi:hypothetical protein